MRLTAVSDAAGETRELGYDPAGRLVSKRWPFEPGREITHRFSYDRNSNLTESTDGEGFRTGFAYDHFGRRTSEEAPGSRPAPGAQVERERTGYEYDPSGNVTAINTPRGALSFGFAYDRLDRLERETNPASESFAYA